MIENKSESVSDYCSYLIQWRNNMSMHVVLEDDLADALYLENDGGYSNFLFNGWEIEVADLFARTKSANKFAYVWEHAHLLLRISSLLLALHMFLNKYLGIPPPSE